MENMIEIGNSTVVIIEITHRIGIVAFVIVMISRILRTIAHITVVITGFC